MSKLQTIALMAAILLAGGGHDRLTAINIAEDLYDKAVDKQ
jgi:hypothetical protein